ncbi:HAD hydrolase, family IIID [Allomyces macrogynus ATCC 38327]|uniref:protein-serine/threonine phosphatase n=1 Tax=Allomyces macrogynus (strain ATCC 38327) TaxID=578462 RepID=A0A0L0SW82_ALLM3|nr:HAD hydrolase, family IIID [Allomyces macrogynus ATCC 38327]|eukprot:KNE66772.1 HAD hydrolase, family IIID [Allomyces macrogynus ATCC 38327]
MDPPHDPAESSPPAALELAVKWAGSHTSRIILVTGGALPVLPPTDPATTLVLDLASATVGDLKHALAGATRVPADAQKLLGLVRGKLPADDTNLAALDLKPGTTVRLMGTPVADRFVEPAPPPRGKKRGSEDEAQGGVEKRQVLAAPDDEDVDGGADEVEEVVDLVRLPHIMLLLEQYTRQTEINLIHAPRPGKRLLVLDLDHTIFDCRARGVRNRSDLLRPGTHDMLATLYAHYDLVIWSQTSWHALERKVTDMGLLTHPQYSISFVLDRTAMFEVTSPTRDTPHQVKPLAIIWARFPGIYAPHNTVHIDDLSRNFALNPRNGIKVSPWHVAKGAKAPDNECAKVTRYLVHLAGNVEDVTAVDHRKWRKFLPKK